MSYQSPILAGEELVRTAIRSRNYEQAVSGWRFSRGGDFEGQNAVIRDSLTADQANFESVSFGGDDLAQTFADRGGNVLSKLDWSVGNEVWVGAGPFLVATLQGWIPAGHDCAVVLSNFATTTTVANDRIQVSIRYEWDGVVPTAASSLLRGGIYNTQQGGEAVGVQAFAPIIAWAENSGIDERLITVGLFAQRVAGTGNVTTWGANTGVRFALWDCGLVPPFGGTKFTPATSVVTQTTFTSTWTFSDVESYQQNNAVSIANNHSLYGYQGDGDAVGNPGGAHASIWIFPVASITSLLSGATILESYVYVDNVHCYLNSGVTALVGTHAHAAVPGSFSGTQNRWQIAGVPKGGDKWSGNLGVALGQELQAGTTKGIVLGYGAANDTTKYSYYNSVKVKIKYRK